MRSSSFLRVAIIGVISLLVTQSFAQSNNNDVDDSLIVDDVDLVDDDGFSSLSPSELTDSSLVHLTQIDNDSMTTGDWFIEFYAPWCSHCKALEPAWTTLSNNLRGLVNVAKIDATRNPQAAERFKVQAFPKLIYLSRKQKLFEYDSRDRSAEALTEWAKKLSMGGDEDLIDGHQIPKAPTKVEQFLRVVTGFAGDLERVMTQNLGVAIALMAFGLMIGIAFTSIAMLLSLDRTNPPEYRQIPATVKKSQ